MTCIYTGCYLQITNYGAFMPADLYRAGEALVLRINPEESWDYSPERPVTHILTLPDRESEFFWPSVGGKEYITAVIPLDAVTRTENARHVLED